MPPPDSVARVLHEENIPMKRIPTISYAILIGLNAASAQAQTTMQVNADPTPPPAYDYVQQAAHMTFDGESLTLSGLSPAVLYFSERPYRVAGQVDNASFAAFWGEQADFSQVPPNAAVTFLGRTDTAPAVVELTSAKTEGSDIVYGVRVLQGNLPEAGEGVALFIDRGPRPRHVARQPHSGISSSHQSGVGFEPYGPYCYHAPQDPRCRPYHPYKPYHPYYPPYPPHGPYYHPGAAYAAGVATGAAIANANKPTYYYYPIPSGPLPPNCYINSQHTQMICTVPLQ